VRSSRGPRSCGLPGLKDGSGAQGKGPSEATAPLGALHGRPRVIDTTALPFAPMLKVLTTAGNEIELDLLLARLRGAGIRCMHSPGGPKSGLSGGRDILVEEDDLDRAREVLKAEEGDFDEDELARLSAEAGQRANQAPRPLQPTRADDRSEPHPISDSSTPTKHGLSKVFERLTRGGRHADAPDNPFGR
jgi:hypothetical protein